MNRLNTRKHFGKIHYSVKGIWTRRFLLHLKKKNPLMISTNFNFPGCVGIWWQKTQLSLWIFFRVNFFLLKWPSSLKRKDTAVFSDCFLIFHSETVLTAGGKMVSMWNDANQEYFLIFCKTTFVKLFFILRIAKVLKFKMIKTGT